MSGGCLHQTADVPDVSAQRTSSSVSRSSARWIQITPAGVSITITPSNHGNNQFSNFQIALSASR